MKKWIFSIFVVVAVTAIGVWAVGRLLGNASADNPAGQMAVPGQAVAVQATEPVDHEKQLMDPSVDLPGREMLIEKIDLEKRAEANRKAGEAAPANKTAPAIMAAGAAAAPLQVETGIFEGSDGMVRPGQADITNYWRGILDGRIVIVFAGSVAGNDSHGMLVVLITSDDQASSDVAFNNYLAPLGVGKLRILSEKDGVLVLKDETGKVIQFQTAGMKYQ